MLVFEPEYCATTSAILDISLSHVATMRWNESIARSPLIEDRHQFFRQSKCEVDVDREPLVPISHKESYDQRESRLTAIAVIESLGELLPLPTHICLSPCCKAQFSAMLLHASTISLG